MRLRACFCVYLTIHLSHQMASSKEMPNRSKRKILVKEIWEVRGVRAQSTQVGGSQVIAGV